MARKKKEIETVEEVKEIKKTDKKVVKKDAKKVSAKKSVEKKEKKTEDGYFTSVKKEMKKVVWPKGLDVLKYTFAVIVFCVLLGLFFAFIDLIVAFVKGLFV